LITEFLAFFASTIRGRRASTKEPFGFGTYEQNASKLVGLIFVLLGIYVSITAFNLEFKTPNIYIILLILAVIVIRMISIDSSYTISKKERSNILMEVSHSAYYDMMLTIFAFVFIIASFFFKYADLLGCIVIGIFIIIKGIKIIIHNIILLKGQNDVSKETIGEIKKIVNKSKANFIDADLINVKDYYKAIIEIEIDSNLGIKELLKIEKDIKTQIKGKCLKIKFVDFEVYEKSN
jgi:divalent metal cation (Fe/Co/Zn/Cd) transporter